MNSHLFKVGGPLTEKDSAIYIEREADRKCLFYLQKMNYLMIIEPRHQGKTSLINYLMRHPALDNMAFVYIDISSLERSTETAWYQTLCPRILRQIRSLIPQKQWPSIPQRGSEWRDFLGDISMFASEANRRVVFILDEIGAATFPGSTGFFSVLRDVFTSRSFEVDFQLLTFLLVGAFHPRDLIEDDKISPFNIAYRVRLPDFTAGQVLTLANKRGWPSEKTAELTQRIYYWTGGQPYLTQLFCSRLELDAIPEDIDAVVEWFRREDKNHLPPLLKQLVSDKKLSKYIKRILSGEQIKFYPSESRQQSQLELLGFITTDDEGFCTIRNRIYEQALTDIFKPKKILILTANPKTTSRLRLDEEVREIEYGLQRAQSRKEFELKAQWAIRPQDVSQAMLDYQPDIVHFGGHGEEAAIVFENDVGTLHLVSADALAGLFQLFADTVECVVLNACYSQSQAEAIAQHIKYVIGINAAIGDSAAIEFAVAFYDALGAGESVEFAYKLACNAIQMAGIAEQHLIPVLITKGEKETLARADKFYELGVDYFKDGEFEEAKNFLSQSLSFNPDHVDATLLLGRIYLEKQQFQQSIEMLERAYQFDKVKSQSLLLQALNAEANRTKDSTLYKQIQAIQEDLSESHMESIDEGSEEKRDLQKIQVSKQTEKEFEWIKNPYRSGNLIQELEQGKTEMFYGRQETIQQLKHILVDDDDGLVIIYGQRRTGKSCLMKYIEKTKMFEPDLCIVFIDMQGLSSDGRFYRDVLNQLQTIIHSDQHVSTANSFDGFNDLLKTLVKDAKQRILIMLDEFEVVTSNRFKYTGVSDDYEFIQRIRNLIQYSSSNIKFALAGADGLKTMISDHNNPLFKAGRTLHIAFLHSRDARDLITKPLADKVGYTNQAITAIQEATYNHPYYIQCLCQTIVWILNEEKRYTVTQAEVDQAIEYIEKKESDRFKDMFQYVWKITGSAAHLILAIIAQELKVKRWVPLQRIENVMKENDFSIQGDILDGPIEELLQKNLIIESDSGLEYTIPIGLLHRWIRRYKSLKRVRRELVSWKSKRTHIKSAAPLASRMIFLGESVNSGLFIRC